MFVIQPTTQCFAHNNIISINVKKAVYTSNEMKENDQTKYKNI